MVLRKHLYFEAESLDIPRTKSFLSDKKNFINNAIVSEYLKNEIDNNILITEEEREKYYEENKTSFIQAKECTVYLYYFKDRQSMLDSWGYVNSQFIQGIYQKLEKRCLTSSYSSLKLPFPQYSGLHFLSILLPTGKPTRRITAFVDFFPNFHL